MEHGKKFPLSAVLSILLDKIVTPRIADVRLVCSFLTGAEVYGHQVSRAITECTDGLKKQCPQFDHLNRDEITPDNAERWIKEKEDKYGKTILLTPITGQTFNFDNVIGDMKNPNKITIA